LKDLAAAHSVVEQLQFKLSQKREQAAQVQATVQVMVEGFNRYKAVFGQAMTIASSLEQRLTFTSKRLNSITGQFIV